MNEIFTRKSIRKYLDRPVSDEDIGKITEAGLQGPSAVNARPFSMIVVKDREMLNRMADGNGRAAEPLRTAAFGILICGDLDRAYPNAKDYWVIDASIVCQNMILEAESLGIGSVWLGTWPQEHKIRAQAELFGLPENIVPHSIISFGYPTVEEKNRKTAERHDETKIHFEKW